MNEQLILFSLVGNDFKQYFIGAKGCVAWICAYFSGKWK